MATRKQEIEARFVQERFRFGETVIASVRICSSSIEAAKAAGVVGESLAVKGDAEPDELQTGLTYRFYGQWSNYTNKQTKQVEKQFTFTSFVQALAHDEEGVVAYLAGVGEGCGVGPGSLADPRNVYGIEESLLKDGQIYVANGQLAKVLEVEDKSLIAQIEKSDVVIRIPRGKASEAESDEEEASNGCSFDLAYALSCHKYQGSECPWVIVLADEYAGAKRIYSFEWWYTGWSRGKQQVYTVGKRSTVDAAIRRRVLPLRKTFLREQIGLVEAEKMLMELV